MHKHTWKYTYLPGDAYRYCPCGAVDTVSPDGEKKPAPEKERAFVQRKMSKSDKTASYDSTMFEKGAVSLGPVRRTAQAIPAGARAFSREVVDLSALSHANPTVGFRGARQGVSHQYVPQSRTPPPIPSKVIESSISRAKARAAATPDQRAGVNGMGVRGIHRSYEVLDGKRMVQGGLGATLYTSPEGAFLREDPRFRHLLHPSKTEDLDALAHHLMMSQQQGGALNANSAAQILQSPEYAQSLRHFKYSSHQDGTDKTAVLHSILHGAFMTGLGHGGTNAFGRLAHHGSNIGEHLAHQGFQHGLLGQQITPSRLQTMKSLFGPESMIRYEAARGAAAGLVSKFPSPGPRNAAIQHAITHGANEQGAPVAGEVLSAMRHELAGTSPQIQAKGLGAKLYAHTVKHLANHTTTGMETGAQRAVKAFTGAAPGAAVMGADAAMGGGVPWGAVGHVAWNGIRQGAAETAIGKRFVNNELQAGLAGKTVSPRREWLIDHVVSPAFLDARRAGLHIQQTHPEAVPMAQAAGDRYLRQGKDPRELLEYWNSVKHPLPVSPNTPPPGST